MLVSAGGGAIETHFPDNLTHRVRTGLHLREDPVPGPIVPPAIQAVRAGPGWLRLLRRFGNSPCQASRRSECPLHLRTYPLLTHALMRAHHICRRRVTSKGALTMRTLRRLLLVADLLGSVLGGYVFSAGAQASHAAPMQRTAVYCGAVPTPC